MELLETHVLHLEALAVPSCFVLPCSLELDRSQPTEEHQQQHTTLIMVVEEQVGELQSTFPSTRSLDRSTHLVEQVLMMEDQEQFTFKTTPLATRH